MLFANKNIRQHFCLAECATETRDGTPGNHFGGGRLPREPADHLGRAERALQGQSRHQWRARPGAGDVGRAARPDFARRDDARHGWLRGVHPPQKQPRNGAHSGAFCILARRGRRRGAGPVHGRHRLHRQAHSPVHRAGPGAQPHRTQAQPRSAGAPDHAGPPDRYQQPAPVRRFSGG